MTVLVLNTVELEYLHSVTAFEAIAYRGHALGGHLTPEEQAKKDFLVALGDKLADAVKAKPARRRPRRCRPYREASNASS